MNSVMWRASRAPPHSRMAVVSAQHGSVAQCASAMPLAVAAAAVAAHRRAGRPARSSVTIASHASRTLVSSSSSSSSSSARRWLSYSSVGGGGGVGLAPPPSVHALHTADSVWTLERCVLSMLGMSAASHAVWMEQQQAASDAEMKMEQERAEAGQGHAAAGQHTSAGASTRSSSLNAQDYAPSSPQLLPSSVYDLMLSRLAEFGSAGVAARVLEHMLSMRMRPSAHASQSLLRLFSSARPPMWREAVQVWQGAANDFAESSKQAMAKVPPRTLPASSTAAVLRMAKLALEACLLAGQPAAAMAVFNAMQSGEVGQVRPDDECYTTLIAALCTPSPTPMLREADAYFAQLVRNRDPALSSPATSDTVASLPNSPPSLYSSSSPSSSSSGPAAPLPIALFTSLIIAHADAGNVATALALMRMQQQQTLPRQKRVPFATADPNVAPVDATATAPAAVPVPVPAAAAADPRTVSARAYIGVIAACMHHGHGQHARQLWEELHQLHRADNVIQSGTAAGAAPTAAAAAASGASALDAELPFALQLPSAFDPHTEQTHRSVSLETQTCLSFHFSPVALAQWQQARSFLTAVRSSGARVQSGFVERVLVEFARTGRSYLVFALLHDLRGLGAAASLPQGALFSVEAVNQLIEACALAPPQAQWMQAEVALHWLSSQGQGVRPNARSYADLLRCYAHACPRPLLARAVHLKGDMDEAGEPIRPVHMAPLLRAGAVCCHVDPDSAAKFGPLHAPFILSEHTPATAAPPAHTQEAWAATRAVFKQFYPSLLTPGMHAHFMVAALHARQFDLALDIFQAQYNADCDRAAAQQLQQQQQAAATSAGGVSPPGSAEAARQHFFRSHLTISTINHLIFAAKATQNYFRVAQLYQLLVRPGSFDVPLPQAPPPLFAPQSESRGDIDDMMSAPSVAPPAAPVRMLPVCVEADFTSHWLMVSCVDELLALRLNKAAEAKEAANNVNGGKQQSQQPQTHGAASASLFAAPTATPSIEADGELLSGFSWTPLTPASATVADLTALTDFCLAVETRCFALLGQPQPESPDGQSVWLSSALAASSRRPQRPTKNNAAAASASPFNVNLLCLPSANQLSNAESALHLTLRRISSVYLDTGEVHDLCVRVDQSVEAGAAEHAPPPAPRRPPAVPRLPSHSGHVTELDLTGALRAVLHTHPPAAAAAAVAVPTPWSGLPLSASATASPDPPVIPTPYAAASGADWARDGWAGAADIDAGAAAGAPADSATDGASPLSRAVLRVLESYRVAPARRSAVDAPADGRGVVRVKAQQLLKCMHGG